MPSADQETIKLRVGPQGGEQAEHPFGDTRGRYPLTPFELHHGRVDQTSVLSRAGGTPFGKRCSD